MRRIASLIFLTVTMLGLSSTTTVWAADLKFTTPSKNIDCLLYELDNEVVADCLVEQATWKNPPKRPSDCELDWVASEAYLSSKMVGTKVTNSAGVGGCRGDIGPLCVADGCTVLAYGKTAKLGRITCTSAAAGVSCVTTSGPKKGFTVSRGAYRLIK